MNLPPQHLLQHITETLHCDTPHLVRANANAVYSTPTHALRIYTNTPHTLQRTHDYTALITNNYPVLEYLHDPIITPTWICQVFPTAQEIPDDRLPDIGSTLKTFHSITPIPSIPTRSLHEDIQERKKKVSASLPPEHLDHLEQLTDAINDIISTLPPNPGMTVHGDAYHRNAMIYHDEVTLIDLDDVHRGYPEEDLAWLLLSLRRIYGGTPDLIEATKKSYGHADWELVEELEKVRELQTLLWMSSKWDSTMRSRGGDGRGLQQEFVRRLKSLDDPYSRWEDF